MDEHRSNGLLKSIGVKLSSKDRHVQLRLQLGAEFIGGEIVQFTPESTISVEGADELSSTYSRSNWASGLASGALYAFRALKVPRRYVSVTELTGRLRAGDMEAVANCASIAVADLVDKEISIVSMDGWVVEKAPLSTVAAPVESNSSRLQDDARTLQELTDRTARSTVPAPVA